MFHGKCVIFAEKLKNIFFLWDKYFFLVESRARSVSVITDFANEAIRSTAHVAFSFRVLIRSISSIFRPTSKRSPRRRVFYVGIVTSENARGKPQCVMFVRAYNVKNKIANGKNATRVLVLKNPILSSAPRGYFWKISPALPKKKKMWKNII